MPTDTPRVLDVVLLKVSTEGAMTGETPSQTGGEINIVTRPPRSKPRTTLGGRWSRPLAIADLGGQEFPTTVSGTAMELRAPDIPDEFIYLASKIVEG